jgi:selenide,water dikinase
MTRLTELAHGGGCGCKLSPAALREVLAKMPAQFTPPELLVGTETSDDAAVWKLNDSQAIVATTDFFTPIVDDPFAFGRIAACNALSDIYAMGGTPIFALALVGAPQGKLPVEMVQQIVAGGAAMCAEAGIVVAGGHSIDSAEPIYGLAAIGVVHPDKLARNQGARAGDVLILGKGLGVGVYSAALKKGALPPEGYAAMVGSATRLNRIGAEVAQAPGVHAMTDVTGFGLLGHGLEICRASGVGAEIDAAAVPLLAGVAALAGEGFVTGASTRNWASYGAEVDMEGDADSLRALLCDPQTSGGLLVSVAAAEAEALLGRFHAQGYADAAIVGRIVEDPPRIRVRTSPAAAGRPAGG